MGRSCFLILFVIVYTAVTNGASVVDFHAKRAAYIEESAKLVNSYINDSANPCTDYTSYICNNSVLTEIEWFDVVQSRLVGSDKVKIFFQEYEADRESVNTNDEIFRDFLKSCKTQNQKQFADVMKDNTIIRSFKTWPIFDSNWTVEKFDIVQLLGEQKRNNFDLAASVWVKKTIKKNVLYITPASIHGESSTYRRKGEEMLGNLSIDNPEVINADIAAFFKEFSQVVPDDEQNRSPELKITYGHFKEDFPNFDWDRYFRIVSDTVPDNSLEIFVVNPERIKAAISTIENMEPRKVANFIFLQFLINFHNSIDSNQNTCYNFAYIIFQPIISRILVNKNYNKEFKENFMGTMDILLEAINDDLHLFQMPQATAMEKLDKIINEEFLPSITLAENNKRLKGWKVDVDSWYGNVLSFYPTFVKEEMHFFLKTRGLEDKILNTNFISYLITKCLFDFEKQPAVLQYDSIAAPVIVEARNVYYEDGAKELEEVISERFKKQLEVMTNSDIGAPHFLQSDQYYLELYQKWAQKNADVIQKEDDLLSAYGLNSMKVLFTAMREICPERNWIMDELKEAIAKRLTNSDAFVRAYDCASGDAINKLE